MWFFHATTRQLHLILRWVPLPRRFFLDSLVNRLWYSWWCCAPVGGPFWLLKLTGFVKFWFKSCLFRKFGQLVPPKWWRQNRSREVTFFFVFGEVKVGKKPSKCCQMCMAMSAWVSHRSTGGSKGLRMGNRMCRTDHAQVDPWSWLVRNWLRSSARWPRTGGSWSNK